jgi:hypothetical protein
MTSIWPSETLGFHGGCGNRPFPSSSALTMQIHMQIRSSEPLSLSMWTKLSEALFSVRYREFERNQLILLCGQQSLTVNGDVFHLWQPSGRQVNACPLLFLSQRKNKETFNNRIPKLIIGICFRQLIHWMPRQPIKLIGVARSDPLPSLMSYR